MKTRAIIKDAFQSQRSIIKFVLLFLESLRLYPPAFSAERVCTKNYQIDSTNRIDKGTIIHVPIWSIHRDHQYYKHPNEFNPERFNYDNKLARHKLAWIPFGAGPRHCIGKFIAHFTSYNFYKIIK